MHGPTRHPLFPSPPLRHHRPGPSAFSLIELVIVIVILAIITAIALPRLSRGTEGAAEASTTQSVAILQKAVDLYAAEHGIYPDPDQVASQLTWFTDAKGKASPTKDDGFPFGPYVRNLPALTTGPNKGSSAISSSATPGVAWVYDASIGSIKANLSGAADTQPTTLAEGLPASEDSAGSATANSAD